MARAARDAATSLRCIFTRGGDRYVVDVHPILTRPDIISVSVLRPQHGNIKRLDFFMQVDEEGHVRGIPDNNVLVWYYHENNPNDYTACVYQIDKEAPEIARLTRVEEYGLEEDPDRVRAYRLKSKLASKQIPAFAQKVGLPMECDWMDTASLYLCGSHADGRPLTAQDIDRSPLIAHTSK